MGRGRREARASVEPQGTRGTTSIFSRLLRPARLLPGRQAASRRTAHGMAAGSADAALAALGYAFVPGPSGRASDWVMRNKDDASKGFEWRGQEDYDAVGAAVCGWVRSRLTSACGLEEVSAGLEPATAYASPGWRTHAGPFLLLVCGSKPGGTAGVWGRALCINATTHEGVRQACKCHVGGAHIYTSARPRARRKQACPLVC